MTWRLQFRALGRLVDLGVMRVSGFMPSDVAHVVGLYAECNGTAAACVVDLIARQRDAFGGGRAASG